MAGPLGIRDTEVPQRHAEPFAESTATRIKGQSKARQSEMETAVLEPNQTPNYMPHSNM